MNVIKENEGINRFKNMSIGFLKNKNSFLFLILIGGLIGCAFYFYNKHIKKKKFVNNKEFLPKRAKTATIYFFKTDWCPYCKKSEPIWNKVKEEMQSKKVNGVDLKFITIDCESDEKTASKYNVDSYPTVILEIGDDKITYDAKIEYVTLKKFINTSL